MTDTDSKRTVDSPQTTRTLEISHHAENRWTQRAPADADPERAWERGLWLDPDAAGVEADAARWDRQTEMVLLVRCSGAIPTLVTAFARLDGNESLFNHVCERTSAVVATDGGQR